MSEVSQGQRRHWQDEGAEAEAARSANNNNNHNTHIDHGALGGEEEVEAKELAQIQALADTEGLAPIDEWHRSALLLLALFLMICGSFGSYIFNLVSGDLQREYHLSQRDLSIINTVGSIVGNCMLPFSFVYDYFGPLPVAILSTIIFPLGALLMGLSFQEVIAGDVVKISVFYTFMNVGTSLYDFCVVTVTAHYPRDRGAVIALLKTFIGLGSAIVGSLFVGFFRSAPVPLLYFLLGFALVMAVLSCFFMRLPKYQLVGLEERRLSPESKHRRAQDRARYLRQRPPLYRFVIGFVIIGFLVVWLPLTGALSAYLGLEWHPKIAFAVVTSVFVVGFCLIALPYPRHWGQRPQEHGGEEEQEAAARYAVDGEEFEDEDHLADTAEGNTRRGKPATAGEVVGQELRSMDSGGEREDDDDTAWSPREHQNNNNSSINNGSSSGSGGGAAAVTAADKKSTASSAERRAAEAEAAEKSAEIDFIAPQYQTSFLRNLLGVELWCLWWNIFVLDAIVNMVMSNSSYIFAALSGEEVSDDLRALLTVLNGVGSAVGRLAMSGFETWSQHKPAKERLPLTLCFFPPIVGIILALILLLVLPPKPLPLPYVVSALSTGWLAASAILVTRTLFARDIAKHYHWCFLADAFGALLVDRFLYGEYYTRRAERYGSLVCLHRDCIIVPLAVCVGLAATAAVSSVVLHLRYRAFCIRVIRRRDEQELERIAASASAAATVTAADDTADGDGGRKAGRRSSAELYDPLYEDTASRHDGTAAAAAAAEKKLDGGVE